jgi:hypothetical protein
VETANAKAKLFIMLKQFIPPIFKSKPALFSPYYASLEGELLLAHREATTKIIQTVQVLASTR